MTATRRPRAAAALERRGRHPLPQPALDQGERCSVRITHALGSRIAGFAVNGDAGATASAAQVNRSLLGAPSHSIVIMHMNHPGRGTRPGVAAALPVLLARGTRFVHLT